MAIPFRADLHTFLTEFAAQHAGVRVGRMFGRPAAYAGRRMFVCLMDDGIIVRLPEDVAKREMREKGKPFSQRGRPLGWWVMYRPRSVAEARRLTAVLETAARHVAQAQGMTT